jgi:two-component system response regulator DevR
MPPLGAMSSTAYSSQSAVTTEKNPSAHPSARLAGAKAPGGARPPISAARRRARTGNDKIQLLLVDEHPLLRAGVKTLLDNEAGVEVIAEADTIDQAVDTCRHSQVDVVLMDVDAQTTDAVESMRRLREELSDDGALVVLARGDGDEGVYQAVVGGAAGHVGEDARPEELVNTIKQAADGGEPISRTLADRPEVGRRVLEAYAEMYSRGPVRRDPQLTERELRILNLAAQGMTNQQIGRTLNVSEHTVKGSISQILARLGLRHRTEAVVYALRNGWIVSATATEKSATGSPDGRFVRPGF